MIFVGFIVAGSVLSIALAFNKYYIERDYFVYANVACQPDFNSCFIGDGENAPSFYKTIAKKAYLIPACDAWQDECTALSCDAPNEECIATYCDPDSGETPCHGPLYR